MTRGPGTKSHKKYTKNNEKLPATFVGSLYKTHAVLRSKSADVHWIEVHDVRAWKFVYFQNIFRFLLYITFV